MIYRSKIFILFLLAAQSLSAQVKEQIATPLFSVRGDENKVTVQLSFPGSKAEQKGTMNIILYRAGERNEGIKAIHQVNNLPIACYYYHIDSTLPGQGTYQYTIEVINNDGLVLRETKTVYAYPAGLTPVIKSFNAKAKTQSNEVTLKWELSNTFLAGNIAILRSRKREAGYTTIATVKNTDKTFLDLVDDANEPFFYQLQILDLSKSENIYTPTIYVLPDFVIKPQSAKNVRGFTRRSKPIINWESTDAASRGFYIYKRSSGDAKFYQATGIIIKDSSENFSWTDISNYLKPGQIYEYFLLAESNSYTKSEPSDTVRISIEKDQATITIPAPQDIRIIPNSETSINILWTANSSNEDITGYAVYQKKSTDREYRLIPNGIASSETNYFTINNPENGSSYIVKAKAGDKESIASRPVQWTSKEDKVFGPKYLKGEVIDNELTISWLISDNTRIKEYKLYKRTGRDYSAVQTIDKNANTVTVKNYTAGETNQYILTAINLKGVESDGTKAITIY